MMPTHRTVFLVDVDDTLLANDRIQDDIQRHLEREYGTEARERYWAIQEELFAQPAYPAADRTVGRISDLLDYDLSELISETAQH